MGYGPTELSERDQLTRPYDTVRDVQDEQSRRATEMTEPPAKPIGPKGPPKPQPGPAPMPVGVPKNPGPPMDLEQADPRDESLRAIRQREAGIGTGALDTFGYRRTQVPGIFAGIGEDAEYRISDWARRLSNDAIFGRAFDTYLISPVRTFQQVADALLYDQIEHNAELQAASSEARQAYVAEQDPERKKEIFDYWMEIENERAINVVAGSIGGGSGGAARKLTRATAEEVSRLSSISQRLRAIGLENDAKAVDSEITLASGARAEGVPTREHLEAFEDIIGEKSRSGFYSRNAAQRASDLDYYTRLEKEVTRRETEAAAAAEKQAAGESAGTPSNTSPESASRAAASEAGDTLSGERGVNDSLRSEGEARPQTPDGEPPQRGGPPTNVPRGAMPGKTNEPMNLGINPDKIDAPQHVKDLIVDEAVAHATDINAQRRGVQPLEVTFAKARNLGISVPDLAQIPAGTAFNAEGAVAIFNAIVKTATKRRAIEQEIVDAGPLATPEMEGRWLAAVYDQNTLQRVFAGGRAELGRGMRALRELSDGANSGQMKDTFTRALDAVGGRKNMNTLLQRLRDIQTDPTLDPLMREIATYKFIGKLDDPSFFEKINEVFYNSILSNPVTWTANALGQVALHEAETLSQFPAAVFDAIVSGGGKFRPRERTMQGAIVQAVAGHTAMKRAVQEAYIYARTGVAREEVEKFRETGAFRRGSALQSGPGPLTRALRAKGVNIPDVPGAAEVGTLPTHVLATTDTFFYALGYQRQLMQDAANFVARDGKESVFNRSFWTRVADITSNPEAFLMDGKSMASRAEEAGRRAGLRQDAGDFQEALQGVVHWEVPKVSVGGKNITAGLRPGIFVAPFVRIAFNLSRVGAEYSPLGFVRAAGTRGGEQADAFGRAVVGSALWWLFWNKADAGELTGPVPSDPQSQKQFYDSGKRPYAIRVGEQWFEYGRYEPIATTLKWIYGMNKLYQEASSQPPTPELYGSSLLKAIGVMSNSLVDSSYLSGINDVYDLASANDTNFERKAMRIAGNTANAVIPYSGMRRFWSQRTDELFRAPEGPGEQIMAATPGLSQLVKPYLTHWGEPSTRPNLVWGLSASRDRSDLVDEELSNVLTGSTLEVDGVEVPKEGGIIVGLVNQDIGSIKLTPDEAFMLQQTAGRAVHDRLAALFEGETQVEVESGGKKRYSQMNDREKKQAIEGAISEGRRVARAAVADAILLQAETDGEIKRAAAMRLATLRKVADRAAFLLGLSKQSKLTAEVRRYLNENRGKGERTVEQYLQYAQGR